MYVQVFSTRNMSNNKNISNLMYIFVIITNITSVLTYIHTYYIIFVCRLPVGLL